MMKVKIPHSVAHQIMIQAGYVCVDWPSPGIAIYGQEGREHLILYLHPFDEVQLFVSSAWSEKEENFKALVEGQGKAMRQYSEVQPEELEPIPAIEEQDKGMCLCQNPFCPHFPSGCSNEVTFENIHQQCLSCWNRN